jgi:hypothetical protein
MDYVIATIQLAEYVTALLCTVGIAFCSFMERRARFRRRARKRWKLALYIHTFNNPTYPKVHHGR